MPNDTNTTTTANNKDISRQRSLHHFGAGLTAGTTTTLLLQPFDVLKTRLQQGSKNTSSIAGTLSHIIQSENGGVSRLWRGTGMTIVRNVPGTALYFTGLSWSRERVRAALSPRLGPTIWHQWQGVSDSVCAIFTRTSIGFLMMPPTVIKVRLESSIYTEYAGIRSAFQTIYRAEGISGFFKGFGPTALRDAPYAGIYVYFYEEMKRLCRASLPPVITNHGFGSEWINMTSGLVAGTLSTVITQPFDLVKTKMQLFPKDYSRTLQASRKIYADGGVQAYFAGIGPRLLRKPLHAALSWTVYEASLRWLSGITPPTADVSSRT